jgi:RNA polymerase sigma-70 factor, ECF subfamily
MTVTVRLVTSSPPRKGPSDAAATLGSVLYTDGTAPVLEAEWVELVRGIAAGEQAALRELYDRTHRIVFTLIFRIVKDPLTTEEVMLDVYHDAWRKAESYDSGRGSAVAWLMNQARSRAIDRVRSERRKKRTAETDGSPDDGVDTSFDPSLAEQRRSILEHALEALTIDEHRAIELAYFHELTYKEVADHLGEPLGTIKTRIRTGLAKLRMLVGKEVL